MRSITNYLLFLLLMSLTEFALAGPLAWPVRCDDGSERNCLRTRIGYPDIENRDVAFNCGKPGYKGHTGTDLSIRSELVGRNHEAIAAAAGKVIFVHDGKYDNCPNEKNPDCERDPLGKRTPGLNQGVMTCSNLGPYCNGGTGSCFWCFSGGNYVVLKHTGIPDVFATYYAHLRLGSVTVEVGDEVKQGETLGIIASSGRSTGPHLHFELWDRGFYEQADPWTGSCGPNKNKIYWQTKEQKAENPIHIIKTREKKKAFSQFD